MPARRVTSADVARAAGVSRATVSYVLNGRADKQISPATQHSVREAARHLRYQPSPAARVLRRGRGSLVLAVLPGWNTDNQLGTYLKATGDLLAESELPFLRYEGGFWKGRLDRLLAEIPAACIVTFQPLDDADEEVIDNAGIPQIGVWFLEPAGGQHSPLIQQDEIVKAQVVHLTSRGCSHLIFTYVPRQETEDFCVSRRASFLHHTAALGLSSEIVPLPEGSGKLEEAFAVHQRGRIGVCCYNDATAYHLLATARAEGLSVPGDMAVIGTDDLDLSRFTDPPLSTVRFDGRLEAAHTARRVLLALGLPIPSSIEGHLDGRPVLTVIQRETS